MPIKKEVQQFIIASECLYRFLAKGESLNSHEAEILSCCMDELLVKRPSPRWSQTLGKRAMYSLKV